MTVQRLLAGFILALLFQGSVFAWHYRDLLYLRRPVALIEADGPESFAANATSALSKKKLTRQHLDTIAAGALKFGRPDLEIEALKRRVLLDPTEAQLKLRLADALRRSGRFDEAEELYRGLLTSKSERP